MVRISPFDVAPKILTFFLPLDLNKLGGNGVEEHGMDNETYIGQEDQAEVIDSPIDAQRATWATKPSTRFAW
jgi:hypothetical protein